METRNLNKKKPCGFQPPFRDSQSSEPSSQVDTLTTDLAMARTAQLPQDKVNVMNSEGEPCIVSHSSPSGHGVFELAAAFTKGTTNNPRCDSAQGANTHLAKPSPNKTAGDGRVLGSHSTGNKKERTISDGKTANTTAKVKCLTTTLRARALKCPAKLLTHKLAVSRLHKDCTVSGLSTTHRKGSGMCSIIEEGSLGNAAHAQMSELSVYELPPTQSEVRSEQQVKTGSNKGKRVLTHEQRLVRKEVLVLFERLHAEIEGIRGKYGHVLNNVYSKTTATSTKDADELWFECNEE